MGARFQDRFGSTCRRNSGTVPNRRKKPIFCGAKSFETAGTQEIRIGKELYLKTLDVEIIATVDRMEKLS